MFDSFDIVLQTFWRLYHVPVFLVKITKFKARILYISDCQIRMYAGKFIYLLTSPEAGTLQQWTPITVGPRHRSALGVATGRVCFVPSGSLTSHRINCEEALSPQLFKDPEFWSGQGLNPRPKYRLKQVTPMHGFSCWPSDCLSHVIRLFNVPWVLSFFGQ